MAEIFATAAAASGVLEQSIKLFARIRDAVERQKKLPELIEKYSAEVSETKTIVQLVENEEALKTPNVGDAIVKLGTVGEILRNHLTKIATTKGPVQDFIHQLVSGQKGQDKLESIMRDLGNAKLNLSVHIQLSNVGLIRGVGEAVQVNITAVGAMNKLLNEKLGSGHVLKISQLLEGRPRNADGTVTLTKEDIAFLSEQGASAASKDSGLPGETKPQTALVVKDNEASLYALQVNTPVGVDIWKDIGNITIERNKATDHASQWNAPVSVEAFLGAMEARKVPVSSKDN